MATFDLYVNLRPETGRPAFVRGPSNGAAFQFPKVYREGKMSLRVRFIEPNPTGGFASPFTALTPSEYTCKVGIGSIAAGGTPAAILASITLDWNASGYFEGILNLNTEELNAVLDASSSGEVSKTFEIELKSGDTEEFTFQESITVKNEVLVTDGGVPVPNTENVFADSMQDILTDSNSVAWRRVVNDIYADVRRVTGGGIAESASGLSVDDFMKTPGLFAPMTVEIVGDGAPGYAATPSYHTATAVVGGQAGKRYLCRIEVDFACEITPYTGGYQNLGDSEYFYRDGTAPGFDINELTLTDGRKHYQLNYGSSSALVTEAVYYADIIVESGDTLTLKVDSVEGLMNSPLGGTQGATVTLMAALEIPDNFRGFVVNQHKLTGLTGGAATDLDGLPTGTSVAQVIETGTMVATVVGGYLYHHRLVAGTDAESSPTIIRPDDYDGTVNARVWELETVALTTKQQAIEALTWSANTLPIFTGAETLSVVAASAFQAADAELSAIAGLTSAADKLPYFTGSGTAAVADCTSFARTLLDDADAATARATLGLVIGTDVQAFSSNLSTFASIAPSANVQTLLSAADYAAFRTSLGLVIGTNVQAYDAELAALAGLTSAADTFPYFTGSGAAALGTVTTFARTLLDDADAATARTTLGLDSFASGSYVVTGSTTDAAPTELLNSAAQLLIPADTTWALTAMIMGRTRSLATWTARDGSRNWTGVASSSDGVKLVAVVQSGQIYTSTDSGVTWTARDSNRNWYGVASSSDGVKLAATVTGGQIYTSTDSGATWSPQDSSRSWYGVASSSDGVKLVATVYGGQIYTSTDSGATWSPQDSSRNWYGVASSSDGVTLVAVVYGGRVYTSTDSGATWTARASTQNWLSAAVSSDGVKLVAGVGVAGYLYTATNLNERQSCKIEAQVNRDTAAISITVDDTVPLALSGSTWGFAIEADTSTGAVKVMVTGEAGKAIDWKAKIQAVELTS